MITDLIRHSPVMNSIDYIEARPPVYVIDDNSDLRRSLHFLLSTSNITAWPFSAAEDFLAEIATLAPGAILLDMRMPGMDGLQTLKALHEQNVRWPVIVMTAHGDIAIAVRAMKLGAIEFLEKPFTPEMLDAALAQAFTILSNSLDAARAQTDAQGRLRSLSPRETEVVMLLIEGAANKTVAHRLALSTRTVEMHRSNAMTKLGVKSVAEAVALVATAGPQTRHVSIA